MDGIIPLWKPKGMTSHDCVAKIRGIYGTRKVGHTGTLDPMVEGVLPICINRATKIVPYLTAMSKTYHAEITLGIATETEDAQGEIVEKKFVTQPPSYADIDQALQSFLGTIIQIPPMYSAVRVKGKRLYEYARAKETIERPQRQVTINSIKRTSNISDAGTSFTFKVNCSQGTYIRTLCVDIGKKLGYPAHMSHLVRTEAGSFTAEETITFSDIEQAKLNNQLDQTVVSMLRGLDHMVKIEADHDLRRIISYGRKMDLLENIPETEPFLFIQNKELLAIYKVDDDHKNFIRPVRVFITS